MDALRRGTVGFRDLAARREIPPGPLGQGERSRCGCVNGGTMLRLRDGTDRDDYRRFFGLGRGPMEFDDAHSRLQNWVMWWR